MSFGSFEQNHAQTIAEINTTPLIDVLLVLLVVFLVTLPLTAAVIPVDLPKAAAPSVSTEPRAMVQITVDRDGRLFWEDKAVSLTEIEQRFLTMAKNNQPQLRLRVDADARFETVAQLLSLANRHHISHVGFATVLPKKQ